MKFYQNSRSIILMFWAFMLMFFALIIWSVLFEVNKSVVVIGVMQPFGKTFPVESSRDGKIISLDGRLGDFVTAGAVVAILDTELDRLRLDSLLGQFDVAELKRVRFEALALRMADFPAVAEVDQVLWDAEKNNFDAMRESYLSELRILNTEISAVKFRIDGLRLKAKAAAGQKELLLRQYELTKSLFEKGFEGELAYLEVSQQLTGFEEQMRVLESDIIEENLGLQSLEAKLDRADNDFTKIVRQGLYESNLEVKQVAEEIASLRVRINQGSLVSPVDGFISRFLVGSLGQYVRSGEAIAEIVPQNVPLMLYVRIPPEHISSVMIGQKALVVLDNMDSRNAKKLAAEIIEVDGNATVEENGKRYFEAVLAVSDVPLRYAIPGVQGSASLALGTQTVASYFLDPIIETLEGSLSE